MITKNIIKLRIANSLIITKRVSIIKLPTENIKNVIFGNIFNQHQQIYSFVTIKKPHTPPPPQTANSLQSFFKRVGSFSASDLTEQKLFLLQKEFKSSGLTVAQKHTLVKFLMSIVYKHKVNPNFLLNSPSVKKLQKDQQLVQLQTYIYIINQELGKEKPNFQLVNNTYLSCFEQLLPNIKDQKQQLKCSVLLHKNFGKYMISCGAQQKGWTALQKSVQEHKDLILSEYKKLQASTGQDGQKDKTNQDEQIVKMQSNALRENIRRLIESMFETVYFYYASKRETIRASPNRNQKQREESILQISNMIKQSTSMKSLVPRVQLYSKYYHRLRLIYFELEYTYANSKKNNQKVKEIGLYMKQYLNSCMADLEQHNQILDVQKQILLACFSLQMHLTRMEKGNHKDVIQNDLLQLSRKLGQNDKLRENKLNKEIIDKLLNSFLKKNLK